ncbi:MAG: tRNA (adenosine(37)-N6)-threonylcarbamoyltransferase complex ATPase subunit type 1 TsaE [Burkholderiales bacterium]
MAQMVKRGRIERHLPDANATLELGGVLARVIRPGLIIFLRGDLGAGKTTLVRGVLRALGFHGYVKSPTFNLVELYEISGLHFSHFDFYRLRDPLEWKDAGFEEHFTSGSVCLIEWPENAGRLPGADITIFLQHAPSGREVVISAETERGKQCLSEI